LPGRPARRCPGWRLRGGGQGRDDGGGPDRYSGHGHRPAHESDPLCHRPGHRFWRRLRCLLAAQIQGGVMQEVDFFQQIVRSLLTGQLKAAADPHRPRWHLAAPVGLLNDPNGFIEHGGRYHLFYQWNPLGCTHSNKGWGHVSSTDLLHWQHEPIALLPTEAYESHGCYSGSAVSDE